MSSSIGGFANSEKLVFTLFLKDLAAYCSVSSLRVLNISNAQELHTYSDFTSAFQLLQLFSTKNLHPTHCLSFPFL